MEPETQQCPHCGTINEVGRSRCANCQSPLTAYAGQITGLEEAGKGRLAEKVRALDVRPPIIGVKVGFLGVLALWALWIALSAFFYRPQLNASGTNYIGAAVGSIGPLFTAILMIPIAIALGIAGWGIWSQQPWGWKAGAGILIDFMALMLMRLGASPFSFVWIVAAGALAFFWFAPKTKAWFGLD